MLYEVITRLLRLVNSAFFNLQAPVETISRAVTVVGTQELRWDDMATVVQTGTARLPIGDGQGRRIVVTYPAEGGYTPGDVYELFVGSDFRLMQWIYHKGGADTPTRMSTWEDHRRIGPVV